MTKLVAPECLLSATAQKRFAPPREFGHIMFAFGHFGDEFLGIEWQPFGSCILGDSFYGDYLLLSGIYQGRKFIKGRGTIRERYYVPKNPRTENQMIPRNKFAAAVLAWQSLTDNEKSLYNEKARNLNKSGYNVYIAEYMSS